MSIVQCKYCHEMVPLATYAIHVQQHERKREDGQQTDYATLPPELRAEGDLEGVPRWYRHEQCGVETGMPEEIIRTYLQNPFFYGAGKTFCHGCHKHVPERECTWTETGENLRDYMLRLQAARPDLKPWPMWVHVLLYGGLAIGIGVLGALKGK